MYTKGEQGEQTSTMYTNNIKQHAVFKHTTPVFHPFFGFLHEEHLEFCAVEGRCFGMDAPCSFSYLAAKSTKTTLDLLDLRYAPSTSYLKGLK